MRTKHPGLFGRGSDWFYIKTGSRGCLGHLCYHLILCVLIYIITLQEGFWHWFPCNALSAILLYSPGDPSQPPFHNSVLNYSQNTAKCLCCTFLYFKMYSFVLLCLNCWLHYPVSVLGMLILTEMFLANSFILVTGRLT